MSVLRLMPTRLRVAVRRIRQDYRNVVSAFSGVRRPPFTEHEHVPTPSEETTHTPSPETRTEPDPTPPATPNTSPDTDVEHVIHFAQSGITLELEPDETILEAGLSNGVDLLFSCTLGGCAACILDVLEGDVDYEDPDAICLTEDELREGDVCLACSARPIGRVVVDA